VVAVQRQRLPRTVWVLSGVAFCIAVGFGVMAPILPLYAREYGASGFLIGLLFGALSVFRLLTMPFAGVFLRRIGPRELAIIGAVMNAVPTALIGLADAYWQMVLFRGLSGVGSALFGVSSMSLLFASAPPELQGRANSAFSGGFVLGGMAGPTLGGLLSGISLQFPFYFYGAMLIAAAVVLFIFLPSAAPHRDDAASKPPVAVWQAFRDSRFRATLAVSFVNGWQSNGVRALIVPLFVVEALHRSTISTGVAFALAAATQAASMPLIGWAVDRLGRRTLMLAGAAIAAVTGTLFLLANSFLSLVVLLCVYGIGAAATATASQALLADTVPPTAGGALSAFQMSGDAGLIIGPMVAGLLIDLWSMHIAVFVGSLLFVVAGVMAWRTPRDAAPMIRQTPGPDTYPE